MRKHVLTPYNAPIRRSDLHIEFGSNRTLACIISQSPSYQHGIEELFERCRRRRVRSHRPNDSLHASTTSSKYQKYHHRSVGIPKSKSKDRRFTKIFAITTRTSRLRLHVGGRSLQADTASSCITFAVWLVDRRTTAPPVSTGQ